MIEAPATFTYASIVSRYTVRIALMIAALNDLEIKFADILNAYVQAPDIEEVLSNLGPEFGEDAEKNAVSVRVSYGLKSAEVAFRSLLAKCVESMGYVL